MRANLRGGADIVIMLERCRELRHRSTDAEDLLWMLLRNRQIAGAKFRRQHQCGPYVLDFCCAERRLVVEADGGQHLEPAEAARDARRTVFLGRQGLCVLRFNNLEILRETEAVVQAIWGAVVADGGRPSP